MCFNYWKYEHLIPINELKAGTYEGLDEKIKADKIISDYTAFLEKRAEYIEIAITKLVEGEDINVTEIINNHE